MGVLSARPELLARLQPDRVRPAPAEPPRSWETGMPSFEEIAELRGARLPGSRRALAQQRFGTQRPKAAAERGAQG
jgi:hypothetical protein